MFVIELNELNLPWVTEYEKAGASLPFFRKLLDEFPLATTDAGENDYEHLEPWIQWVSIHTGQTYDSHQIFRLNQANLANDMPPQIFERLENEGAKVGVVGCMNAVNRLSSGFFVPDPWSNELPDTSISSRLLHALIAQVVGDNAASKISLKSLCILTALAIRTLTFRDYLFVLKTFWNVDEKKIPKVILLDLLLTRISLWLREKHAVDVCFLFLNGAAHIQHHYLLDSVLVKGVDASENGFDEDPIFQMLKGYDYIMEQLFASIQLKDFHLITGLSQVAYDREKYYYRLKDPQKFVQLLGISGVLDVVRTMARDFQLIFSDPESASAAKAKLLSAREGVTGERLFGDITQNRTHLNVTFRFPFKISKEHIVAGFRGVQLNTHCIFVARKNGMHSRKGFYLSDSLVGEPKENCKTMCVSTLFDRFLETAKKVI